MVGSRLLSVLKNGSTPLVVAGVLAAASLYLSYTPLVDVYYSMGDTKILSSPAFRNGLIVSSFTFFGLSIVHSFFSMSFLGLYGVFVSQLITLSTLWLSLYLSLEPVAFAGESHSVVLFKWFVLSSHVVVSFELFIDIVSISFALLTSTIALFVLLYAFAYFRYEPNVDRLVLMICAFVWSMVLLVLSGNMFVLLLGWELIGITSFLLINFWATRVGTFKAAFKAFTFNKFSDAALIFSIILMSMVFQDLSVSTIIAETPFLNTLCLAGSWNIRVLEIIVAGLLLSASIKSAQLFGHLWLPDSMEAPVPASALIHSATLVSAGIFLILRLYPLFEHSWLFYNVMPIVGSATAAYGGLVAAYQTDVKRLLAYSTISHCGFLMLLTTLGSIEHTLVYLYIHGFFKAMSFLCIGNVIRFAKNYQDLRRMGNFWKFLPVELSLLTLALLNLSGAPLFWGFVCKHLVVSATAKVALPTLVWSMALLGALMGPLYSYRLITHIFFDTTKARKSVMLAPGRSSLASRFNSNTPIAGWLSIMGLCLCAYVLTFLFVSNLVWDDNLMSDVYSINMIDQSSNVQSQIKPLLFNMALFNWVALLVWVGAVCLRWGRGYNSLTTVDNLVQFSIAAAFAFATLRLY